MLGSLTCAVAAAGLAGGCAQMPASQAPNVVAVATTGKAATIAFFTTLNPDCTLDALPTIRIVERPAHGSVAVTPISDFPAYAAGSQRFECSKKRAEGLSLVYNAAPGYAGDDTMAADVIWPTSTLSRYRYRINVGSTASEQGVTEQVVSRTVAAGTEQRLDYYYSLYPDCTSMGEIQSRVLSAPQHGRLRVDATEVFSDFARTNPRYECNRRKSPGLNVSYQPASGYVGKDSARVEILYPNQSIKLMVYEVVVE